MSWTLAGYTESVASSGKYVKLAAPSDQHIHSEDKDIFVPEWASKLAIVFGAGASLQEIRMTSPSLDVTWNPDLSPVNRGSVTPSSPVPLADLREHMLSLEPTEQLNAQIVGDDAGTAEQYTVIGAFVDSIDAVPSGEIKTVKATGSTTLDTNEWTAVPLTFEQQLPAGTYAIVGMRAESSGAQAARLIIPGSQYRPGVVAVNAKGDLGHPAFREGGMGVFGTFGHQTPPKAEFLSTSADSSETVYLDLIKV